MFPMMFLKFSIGFFFQYVLKIPKGVLHSKYLIFLIPKKKKKITTKVFWKCQN